MHRPLNGLIVGVCLGLAAALSAATPFGVALEEDVGLSGLFKTRGSAEPPPGVVVVAADRRSADDFGLPPDPRDWPRFLHGTLIDRLVEARVSLIVFDMAFVRSRSIEEDLALAQAISRSGRVILFASMRREQQPAIGRGQPQNGDLWRERMQMPPPHLAGPALAVAPFPLPKVSANVRQFWGFSPDADGTATLPAVALQALEVETWLQVVQEAGLLVLGQSVLDETYAAAANDLDEVPRLLRRTFQNLPRLESEVRRVIDERRQAGLAGERDWQISNALADLYAGPDSHYLNLYGPPGTIKTISYHEVIRGKSNARWADESALAGAVVFVGASDPSVPGKGDAFPTVFTRDGVDLSGVEIAATAFANLLSRSVLRPIEPLTTTLVLFAFGAFVGSMSCMLPAPFAVPLAVALAGGYAIAAHLLFTAAQVWVPLAIPLLGELPLALIIGTLFQYVSTRRQRNRMQRALDHYVPPGVARELADRPQRPVAANEALHATCLAASAENFAALAEGMTPDAALSYLNQYFDALAEAMHPHQADVMKFHIDGVLYAWTSERTDAGVRLEACRAALAAVEAIDGFNRRCPPLCVDVRVGLHAGPVSAGGAAGGVVFEAVGAVADTAASIRQLNTQVGTRLLATEAATADLDELLLLRPLGAFALKGRKVPVAVVEIVTLKDHASMAQLSLCGRFGTALEAFRTHQWRQAADEFEAILAAHPDDGPSRFYLKTCRSRRKTAPPAG